MTSDVMSCHVRLADKPVAVTTASTWHLVFIFYKWHELLRHALLTLLSPGASMRSASVTLSGSAVLLVSGRQRVSRAVPNAANAKVKLGKPDMYFS